MQRRNFLQWTAATGAAMTLPPASGFAADGFRVPPEEARHQLTFMQWPVSRKVHPDRRFLEILQRTIAEIASTIAAFEPVVVLAARDDHAAVRRLVTDGVDLWDIPTEDLWCRDSGPIFATNASGQLAVRDIAFNGWGNRQVHRRDGLIARRIADRLHLPLLPSGLTGEAGGVEQNGHGTLIAHASSWVNANRNPGLAKQEVEARLLAAYGADRLVWAEGLRGQDITDYHIDSLVRFTGRNRLLINLPKNPDPRDPFHRAAARTAKVLGDAGFSIDTIPEPVKRRVRSRDFVASYANFYVCNGAVITAEFGDPETDAIAVRALSRHFPGREIVALNVDPIGEVGGGIHCATHEMPGG